MRAFVNEKNVLSPVTELSFAQTKQAAAIMDCIGRMIPHEGVDYDVHIIFHGNYSPSVSMDIVPHTDKGEWWKRYVAEMIKKYPPTVENPEPSIKEDEEKPDGESSEHTDKEAEDAQVVP